LQLFLKAHPGATRDDYDIEVAKIALKAKPDLVVLAGWKHVFGDGFLDLLSGAKSVEGMNNLTP
jgi:phosphoribosylglycinamide formyltransferase